jgi:hypothetical protein
MPTDPSVPKPPASETAQDQASEKRPLTPEAERALAEAAARRAKDERQTAVPAKEVAGRSGLDPTRYGDWEVGGLTSDF